MPDTPSLLLVDKDRDLTIDELKRNIDLKIALLERKEKAMRDKAKSSQRKGKTTKKSRSKLDEKADNEDSSR